MSNRISKRVRLDTVILTIVYLVLVAFSFKFLAASRTNGPDVYTNLHPWFWTAYLMTALVLAAIIVFKAGRSLVISSVIIFSVLSTVFLVIVFPSWGADTWVSLGFSRRVYDNVLYDAAGNPLSFYFFRSGRFLSRLYHSIRQVLQYSLTVIFARTFCVDIYWSHLLIVPLLWGIFLPVISYSFTKTLCKRERSAILSGFLVLSVTPLVGWGAGSVAQSFGYIFFFLTVFLSLEYLTHGKIFPAIISMIASFLGHPESGVMSLSILLLAVAFKNYQTMKHKKMSAVLLTTAFLFCASLLPIARAVERFFYPLYAHFTLSKILELPAYDAVLSLVFTKYGEFTLGEFITRGGIVELLGFLALVTYSLFKNKKVNSQLCRFLLLAFLIVAIDLRILTWFMAEVVTMRVAPLLSFMAVPSAGIVINNTIESFSPTRIQKSIIKGTLGNPKSTSLRFSLRKVAVMALVVVCLAGMRTTSVYNAFDIKIVGPTEYDVEAARFIDQTTPEKYVVICDYKFWLAGYQVVGVRNPRAYYPYVWGGFEPYEMYDDMVSDPSPEIMIKAAQVNDASIQYFVVGSHHNIRGTTFPEVVEKASIYFEAYAVFGDEKDIVLYVFRYTTPPYLSTSDVSAFYWDNPPSYIVQNDLIHVNIPQNKSIEVRDSRRVLYESIDFSKTLVDGKKLGNVSRFEFFDPYLQTWTHWDVEGEVCVKFAMKQQFKFRLQFSSVTLVGVVERGKPYVQLRWESLDDISHKITNYLQTGRLEQFSIPGLIASENPGSVHLRRYGPYTTLSRTEKVTLHYGYMYEDGGSIIYPYRFKSRSKFATTRGYFWHDLYVDNDADSAQWVYIEMYLPDEISVGVLPPLQYSTDSGGTWTNVYEKPYKPLETINGTEVNWVVSAARQSFEEPIKWVHMLGRTGGQYTLPESFMDSGGCWNRIIFGMYLLGDTNPDSETSMGADEGDQVLIRIGAGKYDLPLDATYVFEDSGDTVYGLRNMNNVFLTFPSGTTSQGGITFDTRLTSLNITATSEDKVEHMTFDLSSNAEFSMMVGEFTEPKAYESLAHLSYIISESDDAISLNATVTSVNDWDQPAVVTIGIPSDYDYDGGQFLSQRQFSIVLLVGVTEGVTETITILPK